MHLPLLCGISFENEFYPAAAVLRRSPVQSLESLCGRSLDKTDLPVLKEPYSRASPEPTVSKKDFISFIFTEIVLNKCII